MAGGEPEPEPNQNRGSVQLVLVLWTEWLQLGWNAPIYALFDADPTIEIIKGRHCHVFSCIAKSCKGKGRNPRCVNHFVDKRDASSTSNLRKHTKICWGEDVVKAVNATKDNKLAREVVAKSAMKDISLTAMFERVANGKSAVTYSHRQHTKTESKAEIVRWVAENMQPFNIVKDRGFQSLMKTRRPEYYIPSLVTVSRDVKQVFVRCRQ
ncbi:hypothetical protein BYT27DRAFT_7230076 [Phlegmacium glaucopus]|nr:hypothetical protein BYT27DRAFT_7230076 [Phlegmacium glaucopus]